MTMQAQCKTSDYGIIYKTKLKKINNGHRLKVIVYRVFL